MILEQLAQLEAERDSLKARVEREDLFAMIDVVGRMFHDARHSPPTTSYDGVWRAMLGPSFIGRHRSFDDWLAFVHPDDLERVRDDVATLLTHAEGRFAIPHRLVRPATETQPARIFDVVVHGIALRQDDGELSEIAAYLVDVSREAEARRASEARALTDPLTGLPNREGAFLALSEALAGIDPFAFFVLDLRGFKMVNDQLGHSVGDELLREVAQRLRGSVSHSDMVARIGGDEFVVLCRNIDAGIAAMIAGRLVRCITPPARLSGDIEVRASSSVGFVHVDRDLRMHLARQGGDPAELIYSYADMAYYQAKREGAGAIRSHSADLAAGISWLHRLQIELPSAIAERRIELMYQPIVELATGRVRSFEALARWACDGKPVSPDDFIPLAEQMRLAPDLDRFILDQALAAQAEWKAQLGASAPCLAVNISRLTIADPAFVDDLERLLARHGIGPDHVVLEISENGVERGDIGDRLRTLADQGIRLSVDDFGRGSSNLFQLLHARFDEFKLDRSFMASISKAHGAETAQARTVLDSVHLIGQNLGIAVVVEGVETEEQAQALREMGYEFAQGWHYAKAMPLADAIAYAAQFSGPAEDPVAALFG